MKKCPKCGVMHDKEGNFCSRHCANSRAWAEEDKLKKSCAAKNSQKVKDANAKPRKHPIKDAVVKICVNCGKPFEVPLWYRNKKYCTAKCYHKVSGGYKKGSARSHSGYYKGVYCDSTYELCWVIYNLDHNISFKRFEGYLQRNGIKYFPDFIIDNTIYEIKNYRTDLVDKKVDIAKSYGYEIFVLYKQDIQYMFDYVQTRYNTKKFEILYDQYKPKYEYKCNFCEKIFYRTRKSKTETVYCSLKCVGKGLRRKK